ncbi:MAG TPA: OmpA family protein, partial [Ohtaekwangia sp.]
DKATGKEIPAEVKDGVLTFNGEKGKTYTIAVDHKDYQPVTEDVVIPAMATSIADNSIALESRSQQLAVSTTITDKQGNVLADAKVSVMDKATGKEIPAEVKNGVLTFTGEKGKTYSVSVEHSDYKPATEDISIPADVSAMDKTSIALESRSGQVPVTASVRTRTGSVLTDAVVITATDKATGEKIPVQVKDGALSFKGEAGKQYTVTAEGEGIQTKSQDIEIPAQASSVENISITLDESATATSSQTVTQNASAGSAGSTGTAAIAPVLAAGTVAILATTNNTTDNTSSSVDVSGHVLDNMGNYLEQARVTVTDKATGNTIPATIENGVLTFTGKKGGEYIITVEHEGHKTGTREITLPMQGDTDESISMTLEKLPVFFTMSARVFKASDNSPLSGAQVKVLNFSETDQELIANEEGIVEFTLMEGETFIVIGSKDGYSGMFTSTVEKGMDKTSVVHPVPAHPDASKELPVIVKLSDDSGSSLTSAQVEVTEKSSGQIVNAVVADGVLTFAGEKGEAYTVEVKAEGYENQQTEIQVDTQAAAVHAEEITMASTGIRLPSGSNLIILNAGGTNTRVYVSADGSLSEIIEKDGTLYLVDGDSTISLGRGNLTQLKNDPALLVQRMNLLSDNVIAIGNIYFDFNSTQLDADDKRELAKVKELMERHPAFSLQVGTHADDRGREAYNLTLSRKRAKAVESYLEDQGVSPDHIEVAAYGESVPLVKCEANDCSETMHQRNRRAEFALSAERKVAVTEVASVRSVHEKSLSKYDELLETYGDVKKDSLLFKVSIGAYRYNHTLTFDELKDLGTIESSHAEGITYYYLAGFATLREVHDMRLKVMDRGVKDAAITIFYKGEKISILTFKSLILNQ